jgi:hypothetical protein
MKFLKYTLGGLAVLTILAFGYLTYSTETRRAVPGPLALAALEPSDTVSIEDGDWLVMKPANSSATKGAIIYSGANCQIHGYAPMMRAMAEAGYLVVAPSMPFDFSIFGPNKTDDIQAAYPEIDGWVLIGHSMGGAMAGQYAHQNLDKLAGLILWDSYPPEYADLSETDLPVTTIYRATLEGDAPQHFAEMDHVFPPQTARVPVKGGIHMYFGSFVGGGYNEVWSPSISNEEQITIINEATLAGLAQMLTP